MERNLDSDLEFLFIITFCDGNQPKAIAAGPVIWQWARPLKFIII